MTFSNTSYSDPNNQISERIKKSLISPKRVSHNSFKPNDRTVLQWKIIDNSQAVQSHWNSKRKRPIITGYDEIEYNKALTN